MLFDNVNNLYYKLIDKKNEYFTNNVKKFSPFVKTELSKGK